MRQRAMPGQSPPWPTGTAISLFLRDDGHKHRVRSPGLPSAAFRKSHPIGVFLCESGGSSYRTKGDSLRGVGEPLNAKEVSKSKVRNAEFLADDRDLGTIR